MRLTFLPGFFFLVIPRGVAPVQVPGRTFQFADSKADSRLPAGWYDSGEKDDRTDQSALQQSEHEVSFRVFLTSYERNGEWPTAFFLLQHSEQGKAAAFGDELSAQFGSVHRQVFGVAVGGGELPRRFRIGRGSTRDQARSVLAQAASAAVQGEWLEGCPVEFKGKIRSRFAYHRLIKRVETRIGGPDSILLFRSASFRVLIQFKGPGVEGEGGGRSPKGRSGRDGIGLYIGIYLHLFNLPKFNFSSFLSYSCLPQGFTILRDVWGKLVFCVNPISVSEASPVTHPARRAVSESCRRSAVAASLPWRMHGAWKLCIQNNAFTVHDFYIIKVGVTSALFVVSPSRELFFSSYIPPLSSRNGSRTSRTLL